MGRLRRRNSVAGALQRLALALTLMLALTAGIGLWSVKAIQNEIEDFRASVTPAIDASGQLRTALTIARSDVHGYVLTKDPEFRRSYEEQRRDVTQLHERLRGQPDTVVDDLNLHEVTRRSSRWFDITTPLIEEPQNVQPPDLVMASRAYDAAILDYQKLREDVLDVRDARRADYQNVMGLGQLAIVIVGLLAVTVVLLGTRRLGSRLEKPLSALGDVVSRHQRGDIDARAQVDQGTDEVRAVSQAFNRLAEASSLAEWHHRQDITMARHVGAISTILAASVTEASHWDDACQELGRRLGLDAVVIVAESASPPMTALGHWNRDGRSAIEVFPDGITEDASLERVTGRGLIVAANPAEMKDRLGPEATETLERLKVQACAVAVLSDANRVVGVLALASMQPRVWQEHEIATLIQVGANTTQFLVQREVISALQELDQQKSDFMATTSHELRTPLTSIGGYLEMFEDGDLGELSGPQRTAVGVLGRNVDRLRGLIEDLLILNRLDSGKGRAVHDDVDLHHSTVDMLQSLEPVAAKSGVELVGPDLRRGCGSEASATPPAPLLHVKGDPHQLERALSNVVSNAVKFTPAQGRVTVTLDATDSWIEFVCQDSGMGIPEKDVACVFDRFFRASNAVGRQVQGTGLGLSIVQAIVEGHGGTMELSSVEGEGTRVALFLPRVSCPE